MKRAFALLFILCLPLHSDDVVRMKDGKQFSGRVIEYEKYIEIEGSDGRIQKIDKDKIDKIEYESRIIHSPEILEFPLEDVRKGGWEFLGHRNVVVCVEKDPGTRIVGMDIVTGQKLWDLNVKGRQGAPLISGALLYTMAFDSYVDEKRKYKSQGALHSKDVHRLTLSAIDIANGKEAWNAVIDNNDRTDLLWDFVKGNVALHNAGSLVVLKALKTGHPIDKSSNLDMGVTRSFITFTLIDPDRKKPVSKYDSEEALKIRRFFFRGENMVYELVPAVDTFQIGECSIRDAKIVWTTEPLRDVLLDVCGDVFYMKGETHVWAYSTRTGKKIENWSLEHKGSEIPAMNTDRLFIFRRNVFPRAIIGYDVRRKPPVESFRIEMPEKDDFTYRGLIGKYLLYTDRQDTLIGYDTYDKTEAFRIDSPAGPPRDLSRMGTGLYFRKGRKVCMADLITGRPIWGVEGEWEGLVPLGEAGLLCAKAGGAELMRDRIPPGKATYLTPTGTPLRYKFGDPAFSRPAVAGDSLYTLGSQGTIYRVSLKDSKVLFSAKLTDDPPGDANVPLADGDRWGVALKGKLNVFDAATNQKVFEAPAVPLEPGHPFVVFSGSVILPTPAGLARYELKTGKKVWETEGLATLAGLTKSEESVWAVQSSKVLRITLSDGRPSKSLDVPPPATQVRVDGSFVLVSACGFWAGRIDDENGGLAWTYKSANQTPGAILAFRGHLATGDGLTYFSSSDGKVVALNSKNGSEKWSYAAPKFTSSLLVAGGKLYFADRDKGLLVLDAKTGKVLSTQAVRDGDRWSPIVLGGKPCFWSSDGWWVDAE